MISFANYLIIHTMADRVITHLDTGKIQKDVPTKIATAAAFTAPTKGATAPAVASLSESATAAAYSTPVKTSCFLKI